MKTMTFPYQSVSSDSSLPFLRLRLIGDNQTLEVWALVDSGAAVNVLPFHVGKALGLRWDDFESGPELGGGVAGETGSLWLTARLQGLAPIQLKFCWLKHANARVILGHENFFNYFSVCFLTRELKFSLFQESIP
jgi:hypothetical protein